MKSHSTPILTEAVRIRDQALKALWALGRYPHVEDADAAFHDWLEREYNQHKTLFAQLLVDGFNVKNPTFERYKSTTKTKDEALHRFISDERSTIFAMAVARLAFGHLDAADDVLVYFPEDATRAMQHLAVAVNNIANVPHSYNPRVPANREPAREWLRENIPKLKWDETQGKFIWKPKE